LVSLVGAENHHDSLFLKPLIKLAQAIGIDIKLITADQAYHDSDGSVLNETGVYVLAGILSGNLSKKDLHRY